MLQTPIPIDSAKLVNEAGTVNKLIGTYFKDSEIGDPFQKWLLLLAGKNPYTYGKKFVRDDGSTGYQDTPYDKEVQYLMAATELSEQYKKIVSKINNGIRNTKDSNEKDFLSQIKGAYKVIGEYLKQVKTFAKFQADLYIRGNQLMKSMTEKQYDEIKKKAVEPTDQNIKTMQDLLKKLG